MSITTTITTQDQVLVPQTVSLTANITSAMMDFDVNSMTITVQYVDQNNTVQKIKQIIVKGQFYANENKSIASTVMNAIQAGITQILTVPCPVQSSIDNGDISIIDIVSPV